MDGNESKINVSTDFRCINIIIVDLLNPRNLTIHGTALTHLT